MGKARYLGAVRAEGDGSGTLAFGSSRDSAQFDAIHDELGWKGIESESR
jgi:hypothetical protein